MIAAEESHQEFILPARRLPFVLCSSARQESLVLVVAGLACLHRHLMHCASFLLAGFLGVEARLDGSWVTLA